MTKAEILEAIEDIENDLKDAIIGSDGYWFLNAQLDEMKEDLIALNKLEALEESAKAAEKQFNDCVNSSTSKEYAVQNAWHEYIAANNEVLLFKMSHGE